MPIYTTYTPEEAIHTLRFIIIYAVAWFAAIGWLWIKGAKGNRASHDRKVKNTRNSGRKPENNGTTKEAAENPDLVEKVT